MDQLYTASGVLSSLAQTHPTRFVDLLVDGDGIDPKYSQSVRDQLAGFRHSGTKRIVEYLYNLEFFVNPTTGDRKTLHVHCYDRSEGYNVAAFTLIGLRAPLKEIYGDDSKYFYICEIAAAAR